jgi:hypothetical protein
MAAERNLPLPEGAWLRTSAASKAEIELDESSVWRLGADSQSELSDYTRLSTGQRITLLSLDHGLAYFTGQPGAGDALTLAVPGAQIVIRNAGRLRLEADPQWSRISVLSGTARISTPAAELDLHERQSMRVEVNNPSRFFLYREVTPNDLDNWNEERDRALAASASAAHVNQRYGVLDLDAGEWINTEELGTVWRPKVPQGWVPYRQGRWHWYNTLGYTWVSSETWGWLPYHYGRWVRAGDHGWVWSPSQSGVFKPGEVYWLRGARLAGWGPLAPGEVWNPARMPQEYLAANTTWAAFPPDAASIDPEDFREVPKEPLAVAGFMTALPSPAFVASQLEAVRPELRAGSTRVVPILAGVTYPQGSQPPESQAEVAPLPPAPDPVSTAPPLVVPPVVVTMPAPPPPPPEPVEILYPVPVYTGVVVMNPPERADDQGRRRRRPPEPQPPAPPAKPPAPPASAALPALPGSPASPVIPGDSHGRPRHDSPDPERKRHDDPPARPAPPVAVSALPGSPAEPVGGAAKTRRDATDTDRKTHDDPPRQKPPQKGQE